MSDQRINTTAKAQPRKNAPLAVPVFYLLFSSEVPASPRVYALEAGATALGRDVSEADGIGLSGDVLASRQHARVQVDGGGITVTDQQSTNGTFVNGTRVTQAPLQDGDVLRVGGSFFLLRHEPVRSAPPEPADATARTLIGWSRTMREVRRRLRALAGEASAVLVQGETGTGKEVAARALHAASGRGGLFVDVNCAAIPRDLAESELFGHEAGSFTGAARRHLGYFRQAHGGTLFLDELGEMPLQLQPKLLRALQEREVRPVGGKGPEGFDALVIGATNRDLDEMTAKGTFRADLHARLDGFTVRLPPLRERREDVLPLLCAALDRRPRLSPELVADLLGYGWPYNVRELFKAAELLRPHADAAADEELGPELLEGRLRRREGQGEIAKVTVPMRKAPRRGEGPSKEDLEGLLREHEGRIVHVAKALGYSRRQTYRILDQHGLDADDFRR